MTLRGLGLLSLVLTLGIVGYLFSQQAKTDGPTSTLAQQAESQAGAEVSGINFQAAATEMQGWFAEHATYAGATLSPSDHVIVVRADAGSYCLQAGSGTAIQHQVGPGSPAVLPGPC